MAWIESHQSLARHRKTLRLAELLKCDRFKAVGVLHFLWWWALDNANSDGSVGHVDATSLARGLDWPVKSADVLLTSLVRAGFVDARDGELTIHDWPDFAGKFSVQREMRRETDRTRQKRYREKKAVTRDTQRDSHTVSRSTNQPTNHVVVGGVKKAPGPRAHEPGPAGPLARSEPEPLGNGAQQCPICRQVFTGEYLDHTAEHHKVRPEPEDFGRGKPPTEAPSIPGVTLTDAMTVTELQDSLREQHEQYLARERQNHA